MSRTYHVWVARRFHPASRDPGLVIDWRDGPDGWVALVSYVDRQTTEHKVVTEWVPAARLTPVPWKPHGGTAYG